MPTDNSTTLERELSVAALLIFGMLIFYACGFAFIPYITRVIDGLEVTYRVTTLHLFVIFGAVHLRSRISVWLGVLMGILSYLYARTVVDHISIALTLNLLLPRIAIPIVCTYIWQIVRNWKMRSLALVTVAIIGTLTNTIFYSAILLIRITNPGAYEVQSFALSFTGWIDVALRHMVIESIASVSIFLMLYYHRNVIELNSRPIVSSITNSVSQNYYDEKVKIFLSYSHRDGELITELLNHLKLLERRGIIDTWYDGRISPGGSIEREIEHHLLDAKIILLLVSSYFFASDFCYKNEMTEALKRHRSGKTTVVPIIVRPVDWQEAPFSDLKMLPEDGKPVTDWDDPHVAWMEITTEIRNLAQEARSSVQSTY